MEVYIDILFLENIVINYIILMVSTRLVGKKSSHTRVLISAIIGAIYVVVMVILPHLIAIFTIVSKLILSILMTTIAFNPITIKEEIKALMSFYISTFIFAGTCFAIIYLNNNKLKFDNGILYYNNETSWLALLLSACVAILVVKAFIDLFRHKVIKDNYVVSIKISLQNKVVTFPALIDTGNDLKEPISQLPVLVVEFSAIQNLLPTEFTELYKKIENKIIENINLISGYSSLISIRLIPYDSLGNKNGILLGFKPDIVEITNNSEILKTDKIVVGICDNKLSADNEYKAIIGPQLVS